MYKKVLLVLMVLIQLSTCSYISSLNFQKSKGLSKICNCNHSSKKEIHSKLDLDHLESEPAKPITCHTAKKGQSHSCSCPIKKDSENAGKSFPSVQLGFVSSGRLIPNFSFTINQFINSSLKLDGYKLLLIKPPSNL
jgi:hypothetical protein